MTKIYMYEKKYFNVEVILTAVISLIVAIISVLMIAFNFLAPVFIILLIVTGYQLLNTFLTNSNPEIVELTPNSISLSSFNKKHTFFFNEITSFKVREFPKKSKAYVRINKSRYWIQTYRMDDGKELFDWLLMFEAKKHPNSLKQQAKHSHQQHRK